jgi:chorismate mutase
MKKGTTESLPSLRRRIDVIDRQIVRLFALRQEISRVIVSVKQAHHIAIEDPNREQTIVKRLEDQGRRLGVRKTFLGRIMRLIMAESKRIQKANT